MVEEKGTFHNPPKDARPLIKWWWPGVDVKKTVLLKDLRELDDKGFLGVEIVPFTRGLPRNLIKTDSERYERCHRFLHHYFFEMITALLEEAKKRHLVIDLNLSSGFPAGGTHIKEQESLQLLFYGEKRIRGNRNFAGTVSKEKNPLFFRSDGIKNAYIEDFYEISPDKFKLEHVVACRVDKILRRGLLGKGTVILDPDSIVDLSGKADEQGFLEWDVPHGDWILFSFYSGCGILRTLFPSLEDPEKEPLVIDHLSSSSVIHHLNHFFRKGSVYFGDYYGKSLRALASQSFEFLGGRMWSEDFRKEFKERRGYDLVPFLPLLIVDVLQSQSHSFILAEDAPPFDFSESDVSERIRHDYELTLSDLFCEKFIKTMATWCNGKRIKTRIQSYGIKFDILKGYGLSHIPESEQHFAGGGLDFLKLAGSAGIIYEKNIVAGEAMVWQGCDYKVNPLKWKIAADRLFTAGINQLIYHGFPYVDKKADFPEVYPFSSPHLPENLSFSANLNSKSEFWDYLPDFNSYVTRCQHVLQNGETVCNTGIFCQEFYDKETPLKMEELTNGTIGHQYFEQFYSDVENPHDQCLKSQIELGEKLSAGGYYYTHLNEESLLDAYMEMGKLRVGYARLEVVIFDNVKYVSLQLAKKLKEVAEDGIKFIFMGGLPEKQPGYDNYQENDKVIKKIFRDINDKQKAFISGDDPVPFLKIKGVAPGVIYQKPQSDIFYIQKKSGDSYYYFIRNAGNYRKRIRISFPHGYKTPFVLDPWTGDQTEAPVYGESGDLVTVELFFRPYGSLVLEFKNTFDFQKHLLASEIEVLREGENLIAYVDKKGSYVFKFDSGENKKIDVGNIAYDPVILDEWDFISDVKDSKGDSEKISMRFDGLKDWRDVPHLKYLSGKGLYKTKFIIDESWLRDYIKLFLSLGSVGDVAVVKINDKELKALLFEPYELDISAFVKSGENLLEIMVITTLNNRLVGFGKKMKSKYRNFNNKKELMPSGLMGPVKIIPMIKLVIS